MDLADGHWAAANEILRKHRTGEQAINMSIMRSITDGARYFLLEFVTLARMAGVQFGPGMRLLGAPSGEGVRTGERTPDRRRNGGSS